MMNTKEQLQWLVILITILGLAVLGTAIINQNSQLDHVTSSLNAISSQMQSLEQRSTSQTELKSQTYTDSKSGISFVVPNGWTVGTDEGGNLDIIKANPYSSVVFQIYTDKVTWQKMVNVHAEFNDKLIKEEKTTIGGLPATRQLLQRSTGGESYFQYSYYYVDGGDKKYLISTSDPSDDITQIVNSIKF